MRKLLISLLCASVLTVSAQTAQNALTPSPVSAAITVGTWVFTSDRKKVFEIDVQAKAATFEEAKKEGFRLAVEHAVGSFILSETEVRNDKMTRDEVITYASGFVDRFEIRNRTDTGNGVRLEMKVWVAHSSIAQRLLNKSETAGDLEGPRVQAKVDTYQTYRASADRVLGAVLNDYPQRAFDVQLENSQVALDSQRQPHVTVPFLLSWNEKYLSSLSETVERINPNPDCTKWGRQCNARSTLIVKVNAFKADPQAWFDDDITWQLMNRRMVSIRPMYRVIVYNQTGREQLRQCYPAHELDGLEYRSQYFVTFNPGKVVINGQMRQRILLELPLNTNLSTMGQIQVSVVPQSGC
jgi:hypothetical protein